LDQPVGRIIRLRLYPVRPFWSLGSGWVALSGGLAVGGFSLSPVTLLHLLLIWLLADPVLGVVWDLGVGSSTLSMRQRGIWRRLLSPRLPDSAPPVRLLPYTQAGSPGYRLAQRLGRLSRWWQGTFWPEAGREFATLVAGLGLALLLSAILGHNVLALALVSIILSWLAVLSQESDMAGESAQRAGGQKGIVTLWHALGEFGIPWLIGSVVMGGPSWAVILLGVCYTIAYFGLVYDAHDFRLMGASQGTVALLMAGLRHPLAAGATAILLMPQWGLHAWTTHPLTDDRTGQDSGRSGDYSIAFGAYLRAVQPFVIVSMLIAALAIAS
jgi:hypothetical protein